MNKIFIPPIKCQGIKSKLIEDIKFISSKVQYEKWVEPFMGSGVVGFNVRPDKAIFADSNPHLIQFYTDIQKNKITPQIVKSYLQSEGDKLLETEGQHYYTIRERFNKEHDSIDFLFLNRACFNGMIRFNSKGGFNVPFCRKPTRFAQAYITKIVNQVSNIQEIIRYKKYFFKCQSFEHTINEANKNDLIYCDPPYIGRHVDYFDSWNEEQEILLHKMLTESGARFVLSTWHSNEFRVNEYLNTLWTNLHILTKEHFYHLGAREENRNPMLEALISNFQATLPEKKNKNIIQGNLFNIIEDSPTPSVARIIIKGRKMGANKNLQDAKKNKFDEFYTQRVDIENEVSHYSYHFKDKVVYCNCDDPVSSEFWKYFVRNFKPFGLKKLMATHYEPDEKNYAYKLEITEDTNGDGRIDFNDEPVITQIPCNGDFRSAHCIDLLMESDIVVTNPPFSLITEYIQQLLEYNKKFLIIAPFTAISREEIFDFFQENKIWLGYGFANGNAFFGVPKEAAINYAKGVYDPETGLVKFRNCTWITNMDIPKRHVRIDLRGNYYSPEKYSKYYNYDGIDVPEVAQIPCDYYGHMGVPITFMSQYSPEQFEIIGRGNSVPKTILHKTNGDKIDFIDVKTNKLIYSVPYTVPERKAGNSLRLEENGKAGTIPYSRIIIKRLKDKI